MYIHRNINGQLKLFGLCADQDITYMQHNCSQWLKFNLKCPLNLQSPSFLLRMAHDTKLYPEEVHHSDF